MTDNQVADRGLHFNLLTEPLITIRRVDTGARASVNLPQLLAAMAQDEVRDFPALRAHQRHPWHAFLCQLAAIALHRAGQPTPWPDEDAWRAALRALTPDHPDDAPWCLVAPSDRPALLQAPTDAGVAGWTKEIHTADGLDMLVTSKNHDLKANRCIDATPEDWLFALVSLQTQQGVYGKKNYGISRMNGGLSSRPGVGVSFGRYLGQRWKFDVLALLQHREALAERTGLKSSDGYALVWLLPWDGELSLSFQALDPFYIEICRRARCRLVGGRLKAVTAGSNVTRIDAEALNGRTGDPWTPVDTAAGKALTLNSLGYDYKLVAELLFGSRYIGGCAQDLTLVPADLPVEEPLYLSMRGLVRGQGKTEGFHERLVPIAPKVRRLLASGQRGTLARSAKERADCVAEVTSLLERALLSLFNCGRPDSQASKSTKGRAKRLALALEAAEDLRFFDDLDHEVHAEDPIAVRRDWLIGLAQRGEAHLRNAFFAGPRSGMQRYRAQSAALSRWHGSLRSPKAPAALMVLSNHLRLESESRKETTHVA